MKTKIVGTGVIGVIYGWALHAGGPDVTHFVRPGKKHLFSNGVDLDLLDERKGYPPKSTPQYPIRCVESISQTEEIVLSTGCGHMCLGALLERAKKAFEAPVVGVLGGLHYEDADAADLKDEIALLQAIQPQIVALSPHDSREVALQAFSQAFPGAYTSIAIGQPIRLPPAVAAP
jgi:ketopantoate reductase